MGHKNKKLLLALMVAGVNQYIARSWRRLMDVKAQVATRGKSRKNTVAALGAKSLEAAGSRVAAATAANQPQRT